MHWPLKDRVFTNHFVQVPTCGANQDLRTVNRYATSITITFEQPMPLGIFQMQAENDVPRHLNPTILRNCYTLSALVDSPLPWPGLLNDLSAGIY